MHISEYPHYALYEGLVDDLAIVSGVLSATPGTPVPSPLTTFISLHRASRIVQYTIVHTDRIRHTETNGKSHSQTLSLTCRRGNRRDFPRPAEMRHFALPWTLEAYESVPYFVRFLRGQLQN